MSKTPKRFVLKYTFKNVSEMSENGELYSEEKEHFNIPWRVFIARKDGHLSIFLNCWKPLDGPEWSIQTDFELKLAAGGTNKSVKEHQTFGNANGNVEYSSKGSPKFIRWEELKEMHLFGGKLTVEAHVSIVNMTGFYAENSMVFDDQKSKDLSDMQIFVEDKTFFVSKQLLASQSSYWRFEEQFTVLKGKHDTVRFSWLDAADFQKYLETLYGQSGVIDEANVEGVLLIATQLSTPSVFSKCVDFLVEKSKKSMEKKAQMAKRYRSDRLRIHCLKVANTLKQVAASTEEPITLNEVPYKNIETINEVVEFRSPTASDVLDVSVQSGSKCMKPIHESVSVQKRMDSESNQSRYTLDLDLTPETDPFSVSMDEKMIKYRKEVERLEKELEAEKNARVEMSKEMQRLRSENEIFKKIQGSLEATIQQWEEKKGKMLHVFADDALENLTTDFDLVPQYRNYCNHTGHFYLTAYNLVTELTGHYVFNPHTAAFHLQEYCAQCPHHENGVRIQGFVTIMPVLTPKSKYPYLIMTNHNGRLVKISFDANIKGFIALEPTEIAKPVTCMSEIPDAVGDRVAMEMPMALRGPFDSNLIPKFRVYCTHISDFLINAFNNAIGEVGFYVFNSLTGHLEQHHGCESCQETSPMYHIEPLRSIMPVLTPYSKWPLMLTTDKDGKFLPIAFRPDTHKFENTKPLAIKMLVKEGPGARFRILPFLSP